MLLAGTALRIENLTTDLPVYFTSKSQVLTTDGSFLAVYARNEVEHGQWDPVGYTPWQQFKLTMVSGAGYLTFQACGVSRFSSQIIGVLLSGLELILFLLGLASTCSRRTLAVVALANAVSYPLTIFSRTPLVENGLLFFLGLATVSC